MAGRDRSTPLFSIAESTARVAASCDATSEYVEWVGEEPLWRLASGSRPDPGATRYRMTALSHASAALGVRGCVS